VTQQGVVLAIQVKRAHRQPPVPVEEVRALVGHGLEGDVHGKRSPDASRQVLLVDRRTLEALGFGPGALREQLTVDLPDLESLPGGTRLRIGEAILELTIPCEPCEVIGKYNAVADPYALRDRLRGRRGMMSRVVATMGEGRVRRGDPIVVEVASTEQASVP
jgi:MOSC domain-containing protein YiiM